MDRIKAIGQDTEVVKATVTAAREMLARERAESDRRLAELHAPTSWPGTALERLVQRQPFFPGVSIVADQRLPGKGSDRATHEALGVITAELETVETKIRTVKDRVDALDRVEVHDDEIQSALASFSEVWDELFPHEQSRVVRRLVEQVEYDPESDDVEIRFHPEGFG